MRLETLAIHAAHAADPATGAVTPPIHLSTTFERAEDGSYPGGFVYSRSRNPNRDALEATLAALEGGAEAAAFASGSAATSAVFQALAPGDHVVAPLDAYYGTLRILDEIFARWGLRATFVDMADPASVERAMRPETRLVWIETPSNPLLTVADVAAVAAIARRAGARSVCDNTWATPVLQRPLDLGCDAVMHSTTKYLSGHSDVTGGALVTRQADEWWARVRTIQSVGGGVPAPFDAWLVLRGIKTLACRIRTHCDNAERVAEFLGGHPRVRRVYYPGAAGHPGHAVAARQMARPGGMLSFSVAGGREAALALTAATRIFTRATSLGGCESLIEHRASVEGPTTRAPEDLLRCSIGLEHPDDLIADLRAALETLS